VVKVSNDNLAPRFGRKIDGPKRSRKAIARLFVDASMNVLTFASRKGGSGKSTLAAHLAAHVHRPSSPCLLIDEDPQSSLTFWNSLRGDNALPIKAVKRTLERTLRKAERKGFEWVFIDTPATMSARVVDAVEAATLVIVPCRPSVFDIAAVQETIAFARKRRTPYAVVVNAAPPRRDDFEAAVVADMRSSLAQMDVPVWGGQIHPPGRSVAVACQGRGRQ
jgi:chromosome partitioning protein